MHARVRKVYKERARIRQFYRKVINDNLVRYEVERTGNVAQRVVRTTYSIYRLIVSRIPAFRTAYEG